MQASTGCSAEWSVDMKACSDAGDRAPALQCNANKDKKCRMFFKFSCF